MNKSDTGPGICSRLTLTRYVYYVNFDCVEDSLSQEYLIVCANCKKKIPIGYRLQGFSKFYVNVAFGQRNPAGLRIREINKDDAKV